MCSIGRCIVIIPNLLGVRCIGYGLLYLGGGCTLYGLTTFMCRWTMEGLEAGVVGTRARTVR